MKSDIKNAIITDVYLRAYGGQPVDDPRFSFVLAWTTAEHGFGELTLMWGKDGWQMETETLGRPFAHKVLAWIAEHAKVTE